ncbi:MAG: hypothetical protein HQK51_10505 [Oligoflexia bacterium]|nr:hypothetical protein [Oligoflexia bacterium]
MNISRTKNLLALVLILLSRSTLLFANSDYDLCKDILRDGVRDKLASDYSQESKVAKHNQFCSIVKSSNLNKSNFETFASNYAKQVQTTSGGSGGGGTIGYGPFNFGGDYSSSNSSSSLSEADRKNLLIANAASILNYASENCGTSSVDESLALESNQLSLVANKDVVSAWKECMLKQSGFVAYLEKSASNEYDLFVTWKAQYDIFINKMFLRYQLDKIATNYPYESEGNKYAKTVNICDYDKFNFKSNDTYFFPITHVDPTKDALVRVYMQTNTGNNQAISILIPKQTLPPVPANLLVPYKCPADNLIDISNLWSSDQWRPILNKNSTLIGVAGLIQNTYSIKGNPNCSATIAGERNFNNGNFECSGFDNLSVTASMKKVDKANISAKQISSISGNIEANDLTIDNK